MNTFLPGMDGEQRKPELSQWFTPTETAALIAAWAFENEWSNVRCTVLEPSAGRGALVKALLEYTSHVTAMDIDPDNIPVLQGMLGGRAYGANFLTETRADSIPMYTLAVMNPPFENGQAEQHIVHGLTWAKRVIAHVPLTTLEGQERRKGLWSHVALNRLAICSTRPKYGAKGGQTAMCTVDVTPSVRRDPGVYQRVQVEWWP